MARYFLLAFVTAFLLHFNKVHAQSIVKDAGDQTILVNGTKREYRLVVPTKYNKRKPLPLVIAFHGMLIDSKDVMPKYTKLNTLAGKEKFLLVYPNALDKLWGIRPRKIKQDLAFFDALLAKLKKDYRVDSQRIYLLGMSNGGYFAHLVGKERSTQVAAVCSHSGPLGLQTLFGIRATRKFPVMIIHGDKDSIFNVKLARENRDKYKEEGHEVNYIEVPGLNHFWAHDVNINDKIWKFFSKHPLKKEP